MTPREADGSRAVLIHIPVCRDRPLNRPLHKPPGDLTADQAGRAGDEHVGLHAVASFPLEGAPVIR